MVVGEIMMDRKDWLALPEASDLKELSEEESYARLLVLMREAPAIIEQGRGCRLTDKQTRAIERFVAGLIESKARIRYRQDE